MTPDIVITACKEKLAKIEKKLAVLNEKYYAQPAVEVIALRRQVAEYIRQHGHETHETLAFLQKATKKEKKLWAAFEDQKKNSMKWLDRIVELQLDASGLRTQIAAAEWQKKMLEDRNKTHAIFEDLVEMEAG